MKTIRAKFTCTSLTEEVWENTARFTAVVGTEGENKDFHEATPSGDLRISIKGDVPASDFFKVGKDYYLDFSRSE